MDKPRPGVARSKRIRRIIITIGIVLLGTAGTYGLSRLKPAAPSVERATLWPDKVKRGEMLRDVHGTGILVPEDFRWIPAGRDGLVERINVRIGDTVSPNTILAELANPDLLESLEDTKLQIKAAEADLANTRAAQENSAIDQQILIANLEATAKRARLQADTEDELAKRGLTSQLTVRLANLEADNAASQVEREKSRVSVKANAAEAQLASQEARLDQLRANLEIKKRQVNELRIRSGVTGVLQQISIEVGQRVQAGATIAKLAEPGRLKAQIRIPETQIKDVVIGQVASIDTRTGIVPGRVVHIDPAAIQGTVSVDVQLEGALPRGARPELSVDGTIEIERLSNVLYVGRPANGRADATLSLFKVMPGAEAVRTKVRVGRVSVNLIEVLEGLQEGDEVILSDMSMWDGYDRVRLN
ncbi:MAG TPA: HlyD family efflux transporter periplasmic adaptor subunit [Terriglobia bacterium]|nr:HlyD family efflux transporter periplasmic adaptor subunit [Terriglobia bacterium]